MKHFADVKIGHRIIHEIVKETCDLCYAQIDHLRPDNTDRVTIEDFSSVQGPRGGRDQRISYDLCRTCFTEKLMPWFAAQGAVAAIDVKET
ncbi:MAG: hypothetical protein ABI905_06570 [Betaproteobacteria bacterium]